MHCHDCLDRSQIAEGALWSQRGPASGSSLPLARAFLVQASPGRARGSPNCEQHSGSITPFN